MLKLFSYIARTRPEANTMALYFASEEGQSFHIWKLERITQENWTERLIVSQMEPWFSEARGERCRKIGTAALYCNGPRDYGTGYYPKEDA